MAGLCSAPTTPPLVAGVANAVVISAVDAPPRTTDGMAPPRAPLSASSVQTFQKGF